MIELLTSPAVWVSFFTLTILEIILGIDNIIFLSIISSRLPQAKQKTARLIGLSLAFLMRIVLLAGIAWLAHLNAPLFTVLENEISWRDLILMAGGLFLLYKATTEIHGEVEGEGHLAAKPKSATMMAVIMQIIVIDAVFSLDSIFTAIGIADHYPVMVAAIAVAIGVMMFAANPVSDFVNAHPTVKMLALSFLILIGMVLVADALDYHIPRGYLYFAIAFSLGVESLNLIARRRRGKKVATAES